MRGWKSVAVSFPHWHNVTQWLLDQLPVDMIKWDKVRIEKKLTSDVITRCEIFNASMTNCRSIFRTWNEKKKKHFDPQSKCYQRFTRIVKRDVCANRTINGDAVSSWSKNRPNRNFRPINVVPIAMKWTQMIYKQIVKYWCDDCVDDGAWWLTRNIVAKNKTRKTFIHTGLRIRWRRDFRHSKE